MRSAKSKRIIVILAAILVVASVSVAAQTQTPTQNESIWQKIKKSAKQQGQAAAQQGGQQVQQVQQGVQQQIPVVGGQANQMNGTPQSPCGSLTNGAGGGTLNNANYTGGGAAGSCGPQCFNAGPFAAAVTQMTMSQQGYWHIIRMNLQFQNLTNQPLIIAYREGSMVMVDNLGNTYVPAGGNPGAVQGMGVDRGNQTDSQFVLGPGQTGNAMYSVARSRGNDSAIGTGFSYNFTIDELQAQNGAQAVAVRQYNLNFPTLAPGASGTALAGQGVAGGSSVAGGTKSAAAGLANYVGGATTPGITVPGLPGQAQGAVVGGSTTAPGTVAIPGQPQAVNRAVQNSRLRPATAPNAVNNAALKTNVVATPKAVAPVVKPIPAKASDKKAAGTQTNPAATK